MNEALHTFFKKNPERAKVKADIVRSMSGQIQQALQHPNKNDVGLALYRAERLIPLRSSETIPSQYFDNFVDTLFQSQGVKFQATARHPAYAEANLDVPSATTDSIVSTYNRVSSIQIGDLVVEGPATSGHEKEGLARAKHYHERLTAYLTEKGVKNPKRVAYELLLRCCGDIGFTHFNYGIVAQLTGVNSLYNVNVQGDPRPQVYFFVQANGTCVAEQITPIRHIRVEESDEEKKRETLVDEWFKLDPANIEDQWVETVVTKPSTTQSVETVDKAPPPISEVE